jgi:hypothetical protein
LLPVCCICKQKKENSNTVDSCFVKVLFHENIFSLSIKYSTHN